MRVRDKFRRCLAPRRSEPEENDFRVRFAASTEEAEALANELRRLNWKMKVKGAKRFIHPPS